MLPEKSQKVVDFNWPVVQAYAAIMREKIRTNHGFVKTIEDYLAVKPLLVRERKELLALTIKEFV